MKVEPKDKENKVEEKPLGTNTEFENEYDMSKEILRHFYGKVVFKPYRILGVVLIILGAIQLSVIFAGSFNIIESTLSPKARLFFLDMGILLTVTGILLCCYHLFTTRVVGRQMRRNGGGNFPKIKCRVDDKVYYFENEKAAVFEYDQLLKVAETNKIYAIMISKTVGICLLKEHFTKGKEEDFLKEIKNNALRQG